MLVGPRISEKLAVSLVYGSKSSIPVKGVATLGDAVPMLSEVVKINAG